MITATGVPSANSWLAFRPPPLARIDTRSHVTPSPIGKTNRPQVAGFAIGSPGPCRSNRPTCDQVWRPDLCRHEAAKFGAYAGIVLLLNIYSSSLTQDRYELARPPRFVVLEYC